MQTPCMPGNVSRALAIAAVLTADALTRDRTPEQIGQMAAFFTVLGDTMALLAFEPQQKNCREHLNPETV